MNAEINLKSIDTDVLPDDAIVSFKGHQYVFAQDKTNQFTLTEVETGSSESGFTQILNASQISGKSIVVKGAYTLLMQMKNTADKIRFINLNTVKPISSKRNCRFFYALLLNRIVLSVRVLQIIINIFLIEYLLPINQYLL